MAARVVSGFTGFHRLPRSLPSHRRSCNYLSTSIAALKSISDTMASSTVVCKVDDLKNGEMKAFSVGEAKVLVVKDKDQFYAVSNKCSHYNAPLSTGSYCNGFVRCPWHGACFSVKTGDIEDFPGMDSLQTFKTRVEKGEVHVEADAAQLAVTRRQKPMAKRDPNSKETVVIIGGGGSGGSCAEALRQGGYTGRVLIVAGEPTLPYDRPVLSKKAGADAETMHLRNADFFKQHHIEFLFGHKATSVDTVAKTVTVSPSGEQIAYTKLVVATGGRPRTLDCPGADLSGVCYLRTPEDGKRIAAAVTGKKVVVVGSSFIGMEMAAFAMSQEPKPDVTIVGHSALPLEAAFGPHIGAAVQKMHESHGVKFRSKAAVKSLEGENGALMSVTLNDGSSLPADVCIAGIGVLPSTEFLGDAVTKDKRGYILVDEQCRTSLPDVYACGDVVRFPLSAFDLPEPVNVQHWQIALKHGQTAGLAIAGKPKDECACDTVPFFWCFLFNKSVRYTGYGPGFNDTVINGSVDDYKFVAYYLKDGVVRAVATMGHDPVAAAFAHLFKNRITIRKEDVQKNPSNDWSAWLKKC